MLLVSNGFELRITSRNSTEAIIYLFMPPLPRIHKLSDSVTNQIAAGEVIERPASVIKELIENSFDAGASEISVDIIRGGKDLIRVRDNGHGIHPQDLSLALTSHATSKLNDIGDLSRIGSLGFRGEALPSIASISRFKLISRAEGFEYGGSVTCDPVTGRMDHAPAAHPVGTTIEVIKLFHTVPARRKFLRSEKTEYLHVLEMIRCMALSRFNTTLSMHHNGRQVFFVRGGHHEFHKHVEYILGGAFTRAALEIGYQARDMRLHGWLGPADLHRSQTDRQYFFLNGRLIRDRHVNHAIRTAYGDDIPSGRYPVYVLYLEMDRAGSDVNVHPTKQEVRFRDARNVHDFIYASLKDSLANDKRQSSRTREEPAVYQPNGDRPAMAKMDKPVSSCRLGQPLQLLLGRYILSSRGENLLLIDSRAVRNFLMRNSLKQVSIDNPLQARPLLVPVEFTINKEQASQVEEHMDILNTYGLALTLISPVSVLVRSIPVVLADAELAPVIERVLTGLSRAGSSNTEIPVVINSVFEQLIETLPGPDSDTGGLMRLLGALENSGLDLDADDHAGLWCTLNSELLKALVDNC